MCATRMEHATIAIPRRIKIIAGALFALATVACSGPTANTPPPATGPSATDVDDATAGLIEHHRHHHHGGVTLLIALSLDTLGVSPEQHPAVERIRKDLLAGMEPARAAEEKLAATLADGVAAGNFNATKVAAAIAQVTAAAATVHDSSIHALNELHALLTPPERAALVDKVEAHWSVWQKANAEETDPAHPGRGRLAMLATDLGLMQGQVDKIRASLREQMKTVPLLDPQEIVAHLRAFGDAFRSETFDAKALANANGANAHLAGWGAVHLAYFIEAVSPELTKDQRAEYAQMLREHASHAPEGTHEPS